MNWTVREYPAKRPYRHALRMTDRALLAGYPRVIDLGIIRRQAYAWTSDDALLFGLLKTIFSETRIA